MRIIKDAKFKFINRRKKLYVFSAILISACLLSIIFRGFNFSIDFKSGTEVVIQAKEPIPIGEIRQVLANANVGGQVREYGTSYETIIKTDFEGDLTTLEDKIIKAVRSITDEANTVVVLRMDSVGPSIARDLIRSAINALIAALIMILIYVAVRFEVKFAMASIVAVLHDILFVAGVFSLLGDVFPYIPLEFDQSTIAALLTVAGYSITDTVVVYDRIRENLKFRKRDSSEKVFNDSLNETLSRTFITSLTTMFSVLVLFFIAGPIIRGFAFAVGLGILIGTYSSLFIAAPLALDMQLRAKSKKVAVSKMSKKKVGVH